MLEKTAGQEIPFIFSLRSQSRELFYKGRFHISTVIHPCNTICRIKDFRKFSVYGHHLRSSQPFRQYKPKFSGYILNLWIPVTFSDRLSYPQQATLCFTSLHMTLAETVLRMFMDLTKKMIYVEGWVFFQLDQCSCVPALLACHWGATG